MAIASPLQDAYPRYIVGLRAASLGHLGTHVILGWLGVPVPASCFTRRATQLLARHAARERRWEERSRGRGSGAEAWSVATWRAENGAEALRGALLRRNGLPRGADAMPRLLEAPGALRAVRLTSSSPHTDRRLCGEIQLLETLRARFEQGSVASGEIRLHVTKPPCLSCVGAIVQFRRLFPGVVLAVSFGRALGERGRAPSSKDG